MNYSFIRFLSKGFALAGKRQRFLSFSRAVAFVSVTLGCMALIVALSVLDGFEKMLMDNAVKFTSHNTVRRFDNAPFKYHYKLKKNIQSSGPVDCVIPLLEREGLIRHKKAVEGILMRSSKDDVGLKSLAFDIKEGSTKFDSLKRNEIIIGKRLAKKLQVSLKDTVILYAVKSEELSAIKYPDIGKFVVSGIYETGMAQYDDIYIYMSHTTAAQFFKSAKDEFTKIEINLKDPLLADEYADKLQGVVDYEFYVYSVFDLHKGLFSWIEIQKAPIPLVLGLISLVAVLNIVTILLITVVEKTSAIGILRSLGMNNRGIMSVFVSQGLTIGAAGTVCGLGIGLLFCLLQQNYDLIRLKGEIYFLDSLPIELSLSHFIIVGSVSLLLSFAATLIPAMIAVKINPITAVKYK